MKYKPEHPDYARPGWYHTARAGKTTCEIIHFAGDGSMAEATAWLAAATGPFPTFADAKKDALAIYSEQLTAARVALRALRSLRKG